MIWRIKLWWLQTWNRHDWQPLFNCVIPTIVVCEKCTLRWSVRHNGRPPARGCCGNVYFCLVKRKEESP